MSAYTRTILLHGLLGGLMLLGLSACSGKSAVWDNEQSSRQTTVELERTAHNILFAHGMTNLNAGEQAKLDQFVHVIKPGAADILAFDTPDTTNLTAARVQAIRTYLGKSGLKVTADTIATEQAPASHVIRLVIERAVVRTPDCPDWSRKAWPNYENAPTSNMGCTTETALGLMIANPRDLVDPQSYEPADAEGATRAIEALQNGKVKWSDKANSTSK